MGARADFMRDKEELLAKHNAKPTPKSRKKKTIGQLAIAAPPISSQEVFESLQVGFCFQS